MLILTAVQRDRKRLLRHPRRPARCRQRGLRCQQAGRRVSGRVRPDRHARRQAAVHAWALYFSAHVKQSRESWVLILDAQPSQIALFCEALRIGGAADTGGRKRPVSRRRVEGCELLTSRREDQMARQMVSCRVGASNLPLNISSPNNYILKHVNLRPILFSLMR
jgi:hypothetical protein